MPLLLSRFSVSLYGILKTLDKAGSPTGTPAAFEIIDILVVLGLA